MESDAFAREYTPEYLADQMRHGFSETASRSLSPHDIAFHERIGSTSDETIFLHQDALKDQPSPTTTPSEEQIQATPSENQRPRHHHRHSAVYSPLSDIAPHCCSNPHGHRHSSRDSADLCRERRRLGRKRQAGEYNKQQHQARHGETADQNNQPERDLRSGTTSSRIKTHCFYTKAQREFGLGWEEKKPPVESQTCSFMVFQHAERSATVDWSSGTACGPELIELVERPRSAGYQYELRIVLSPENKNAQPMTASNEYVPTNPFPFEPSICEKFFDVCNFHKGFFEISKSGHSHVIQNARVNSDNYHGTHSFFMGLGDGGVGKQNMKVFVSYKQCERLTTVFIHDCSPAEKDHLLDRLMDNDMQPLTLHPLFILVLIAEQLQRIMWIDIKANYHEAQKQMEEAGNEGLDSSSLLYATRASGHSLRISQSMYANKWRMSQLREFITNIKNWSRGIKEDESKQESSSFKEARKVLDDRLVYLEGSLEEAQWQVTATIEYAAVYRHWLDVHIANTANSLNLAISKSAFSMTVDSRKDQSAIKAISYLSILFLPASFFCGLFNLPFFDWKKNRPINEDVVDKRIWYYWVCSITTTLMVLIIWRLIFRFEKWRLSRGDRKKDIRRDLVLWARGGFKQSYKRAQEGRVNPKKEVLEV